MLPQLSASNSPNEYLNYDLDTSCIFFDNNVNIYNQVDNPYSNQDVKNILNILKKNKINCNFDLAFVPYCAASEYPQSFIDRDRKKAKNDIIKIGLKKLFSISNILKCKNLIPAGGSYKLDGIFNSLNKFLAVPNFREIEGELKGLKKKFILRNTQKLYFEFDNHKLYLKKNNFFNYFKDVITKNNNDSTYLKIKSRFNSEDLLNSLRATEENFPDFKKKLYNLTDTNIDLCVWNKQPVLIKNIKNKRPNLVHRISFGREKKVNLKIHIYYKLLIGLIYKDISWNAVQNHCLYERYPDVYDPDAIFWMNLYKNNIKITSKSL